MMGHLNCEQKKLNAINVNAIILTKQTRLFLRWPPYYGVPVIALFVFSPIWTKKFFPLLLIVHSGKRIEFTNCHTVTLTLFALCIRKLVLFKIVDGDGWSGKLILLSIKTVWRRWNWSMWIITLWQIPVESAD